MTMSNTSNNGSSAGWPLWEGFVRSSRGLSHVHAGSLHAPDAELAVGSLEQRSDSGWMPRNRFSSITTR